MNNCKGLFFFFSDTRLSGLVGKAFAIVHSQMDQGSSRILKSPLHVGRFDFVRQTLISQVGKQLRRLNVDVSVDNVHELRSSTEVLQVDVVDVSDVGETVVLRVFHVQHAVDYFSFRHLTNHKQIMYSILFQKKID